MEGLPGLGFKTFGGLGSRGFGLAAEFHGTTTKRGCCKHLNLNSADSRALSSCKPCAIEALPNPHCGAFASSQVPIAS